jgi:hypothetical protein
MRWAGINPGCFDLFTHIDNMCFVKPHVGYYRQICDMINTSPDACLMVGNDPESDMAASGAGMWTYLTTDAHRAGFGSVSLTGAPAAASSEAAAPDFSGPLCHVTEAVDDLCRRCLPPVGRSVTDRSIPPPRPADG